MTEEKGTTVDTVDESLDSMIPDDFETDTDAAPEEGDTQPDTGDEELESPDTKEETPDEEDQGPEVDDLLKQYELDGTYKTVDDALRATREQQQYISRTQAENAELRRILQQVAAERKPEKTEEADPPEDIWEGLQKDFNGTLRRMGYVHKEDVGKLEQRLNSIETAAATKEYHSAVDQYPELTNIAEQMKRQAPIQPGVNPYWDEFNKIVQERPGILQMRDTEALATLMDIAKGRMKPKANVTPVSKDQKNRASTTSKASRRSGGDVPDFGKMEPEEIKKWYAERGMYS